MTTRRSFIASILAAGMAPAIGHAGILMPVRKIIAPEVVPVQLGMWIGQDEGGGFLMPRSLSDAYKRLIVEKEFRYLDSARRINVLQREWAPVQRFGFWSGAGTRP